MKKTIDSINQNTESGEDQKTSIKKTAKGGVIKVLASAQGSKSKKIKNQNDVIEKDRENILDKDSAAIVKKEKGNLYTIFGNLKSSDFYSIFNELGIKNNLKHGEVSLLTKGFFMNSDYEKLKVVIKIKYQKAFEKIEDLLAVIDENPDTIDIMYKDYSSGFQKYNTFEKEDYGYRMRVDDDRYPSVKFYHYLFVEEQLQSMAINFCKKLLMDMLKKHNVIDDKYLLNDKLEFLHNCLVPLDVPDELPQNLSIYNEEFKSFKQTTKSCKNIMDKIYIKALSKFRDALLKDLLS